MNYVSSLQSLTVVMFAPSVMAPWKCNVPVFFVFFLHRDCIILTQDGLSSKAVRNVGFYLASQGTALERHGE